MYRILAYKYPNNEIRIRMCPSPPAIDPFKVVVDDQAPSAIDRDNTTNTTGVTGTDDYSLPSDSLDISFDLRRGNDGIGVPGFGIKGRKTKFGLKGRRTILRCGGVIDTDHETKQTLMLTGTLPGSTPEALEEICKWTSYLVDRLKSWIAFHVKETYSMYTWELQKRGALHLHYVVTIAEKETRDRIRLQFKKQWYRLLENITEKSGVDVFAKTDGSTWRNDPDILQAHAVECENSVAAYISKYISKHKNEYEGQYYPVRWYGCSRPLLKRLRELTEEVEIDKLSRGRAEMIYENCLSDVTQPAVSAYNYRDKVGRGENLVTYHYPAIVEEVWKYVQHQVSPMTKKTMKPRESRLDAVQSIMTLLKSEQVIYARLRPNFSGFCREVIMKSWNFQQLTPTELALSIAELHSLLCADRLSGRWIPVSIQRWMEQYEIANPRKAKKKELTDSSSLDLTEVGKSPDLPPISGTPENKQLSML